MQSFTLFSALSIVSTIKEYDLKILVHLCYLFDSLAHLSPLPTQLNFQQAKLRRN